jgi:hypothetical protein
VSMISWSKVGKFDLPTMRDPALVTIATSPVKSSARGRAGMVFELGRVGCNVMAWMQKQSCRRIVLHCPRAWRSCDCESIFLLRAFDSRKRVTPSCVQPRCLPEHTRCRGASVQLFDVGPATRRKPEDGEGWLGEPRSPQVWGTLAPWSKPAEVGISTGACCHWHDDPRSADLPKVYMHLTI